MRTVEQANQSTQGIFRLYKEYAEDYVNHRLHKPYKIDRAQMELTLYDEIAKHPDLDPNVKIAWAHAVREFAPFSNTISPSPLPLIQLEPLAFHLQHFNHLLIRY